MAANMEYATAGRKIDNLDCSHSGPGEVLIGGYGKEPTIASIIC